MRFTIETVSKMTGIPAASLRNWEKRYNFPRPERTGSGHRFYSDKDIDFLKKAAHLIEQGHPLTEIAELYKNHLKRIAAREQSDLASHLSSEILDDVTYRAELLYQALIKFDVAASHLHYQVLNVKLSPEQIFDRVFEVILRRLGTEWSADRISVAQEHFASSFLRLKLGSYLAIDFPSTQPHRILAATLMEERHEGGLMLVSAHLKFRGYPVYYFGSDLPLAGLKEVCAELKPHVVTLSYSRIERLQEDLATLEQLGCPVVVGGIYAREKTDKLKISKGSRVNIFFCEKAVGSEAAQYVEMICQRK